MRYPTFILLLLVGLLMLAACANNATETATPTADSPATEETAPESEPTGGEPVDEGGYPATEGEDAPSEGMEGYPAPPGDLPESTDPEGYPATEPEPADGEPADDEPVDSESEQPESYATPPGGALTDSGTSNAGDCTYDYFVQFQPLLAAQPELQQRLGCPSGPAAQSWAAWQPFENGNQMLWLENYDAIVAMYGGQWHGAADTYEEGEPETPANAPTPPSPELLQPIRGFGKAWVGVADEMGFATAEEGGYFADLQPMEGGWMARSPVGPLLVMLDMQGPQEGSGELMSWVRAGETWTQQE